MIVKTPRIRFICALIALFIAMAGCAARFDETGANNTTPSQEPTQEPRQNVQPTEGRDAGGQASGGISNPGLTEPAREALQLGGGLHKYSMDLELDEQSRLLTGSISIDYTNPTGKQLGNLYFHLYPKAFSNKDTAPFFSEEMGDAYPNGYSRGDIDISSLTVDGAEYDFTLENEDNTLMNVALPIPLSAGASARVEMQFTVTLPNCLGRFGYGDNSYNLCNFYPIAAAYDGMEFYKYPYYMSGDPFVSDVCDYEVNLTVPEGMKVAHTGSGTSSTVDGITNYSITAPMVRDFAAVASRQFDIVEQKVGNVRVKSFYYRGMKAEGKTAMSSAADAIKIFGKCFGQYPYDEYCVVQTDFFIGGMEYPGLVLIDESLYDMDMMLEYVVVHETAHQWWYAVVGNDQIMEPWLDEALAEYSTLLYYGENYDEDIEQTMYNIFVDYNVEYYEDIYGEDSKGVGEPSRNFTSSEEYSYCIYINGTRMFTEIEQAIGRPTMKKVLSCYFKNNMYKRSTAQILINAFNKESNEDLTPMFQKWID